MHLDLKIELNVKFSWLPSRYRCSLKLLNVLLKLTHFVQIPLIILELMIVTASCRKKKIISHSDF